MKCGVTDEGCAALASALRSNPSHLRDLNLSENELRPSEVKLLSDLKDDSHYKLETLDYCEYIIILKVCNRLHMCVIEEYKIIIQLHFSPSTLNCV